MSSYIDSTGNMRLRSNKPALYILTNGADKDPWPSTTSRSSRCVAEAPGERCAAVVHFRPPYGVRELAGPPASPLPPLRG